MILMFSFRRDVSVVVSVDIRNVLEYENCGVGCDDDDDNDNALIIIAMLLARRAKIVAAVGVAQLIKRPHSMWWRN